MNTSVALCTYNGESYLAEQLASISTQDLLPDELVLCDDGSTDATLRIAEDFAATAPFAVRIERNAQRLGARDNFAKAIALCRGRWIVLADQDDVWLPHKLRRFQQCMEQDPELGMVFSDALMVDRVRRPLGYTLWQAIRFHAREQRQIRAGRALDVLLRHNAATGACMAFRAEYRDMLLPIPGGWVHDGWIALLLAAVARCAAISEPLVEYRQHESQQIGEKKRSIFENYLRVRSRNPADYQRVAGNFTAARARLAEFASQLRRADTLSALEGKASHFRAKSLIHSGVASRWPLILRELIHGNYARYSAGWRSLAEDVLV